MNYGFIMSVWAIFVMKHRSVAMVFEPTNQHQHMEDEKDICP